MHILFYYFYGSGGGLTNLMKLLEVYANTFPDDTITLVSHPDVKILQLSKINNINANPYGGKGNKEWDRLKLGFGGLNRMARKINADIIWSVNLGSYIRSTIPQVMTMNNAFQVYPKHILKHHPSNSLRVRALRFFFNLSAKKSRAIILQTDLMAKYCKISIKNIKTYVVPKAVEESIDHYAIESDNRIKNILHLKEKGQKLCIYIATNIPHKNHVLLFKAFKHLLNQKVYNISVMLSLSKKEILEIDRNMEVLIDKDLIIPLGWVQRQELKSFYDLSDISVMPSKLESLSSSHIESMKWEKPIISSDLSFGRDLCKDAALYVDPNDAEEWAKQIQKLLENEMLRKKLVAFSKTRIKSFPASWEEVAITLRGIFNETIENEV